jgi:formate-nitrite transporter family protein
VIRRQGQSELERPLSALAWSGLAAGLAMALSLMAEGVLRSHLPDASWRPLITKLGYPVGFLVVVLGSQQLYTENTLMPVVPVLANKEPGSFKKMLALWTVVFIANIVGAAIMAMILARTILFDEPVRAAFAAISREAMAPGAIGVLWRGVFAGWLIALMMWMIPAAESAQIWVVVVMTFLVGIARLSHVIAGSVAVFYLVANGEQSVASAFGGFILPALVGNTLGGVALVAALNHAQVVSGS